MDRYDLNPVSRFASDFPQPQITTPANIGASNYSSDFENMYMVWTATVPVPASLSFLTTAVAGFAGLGMRRKRQAQA